MIRKYAEIFCWKNASSFCSAKATHIFSAKNIRILCIESTKTVNEMTLNELVKLTTLWTTGPWCLIVAFSVNQYISTCLFYNIQWFYIKADNMWHMQALNMQAMKALIRPHICAVWSEPAQPAYAMWGSFIMLNCLYIKKQFFIWYSVSWIRRLWL